MPSGQTIPIPRFWSVPDARRKDDNHDSCTCDYKRFQLDYIRSKFRLPRKTRRFVPVHGGDGDAGLSTAGRAASTKQDTEQASTKCTTTAAQATERHAWDAA